MSRGSGALREDIRAIVDDADRRVTADEIYGRVRVTTTRNNFNVTLCTMVKDRQLTKRKTTKAQRRVSPNARLTYGPGRVPVCEGGGQGSAEARDGLHGGEAHA